MNKQHTNSLQDDAVSALADGELQGEAFALAVQLTCEQAEARERWHAYHVVGDVLRSREPVRCTGDLAFLAKLEARLALEPAPALSPQLPAVPLPRPRPAANGELFRWKAAAGFASLAAVAAIGWQSLQWQAPSGGAVLAQSTAAAPAAGEFQAVRADLGAAPALVASEQPPVMLRNAQLDELLAAHNRAVGGATLQSQGRLLRNVSAVEDMGR